jgi:hypothetical protein
MSLFTGCCHCRSFGKEEMMPLGASLTELSTAIEGHVRYNRNLPAGISGEELLDIVNEDNSQLLEPFEDYLLRVHPQDKHAIVLVCTKDGKTGLLEDAGCTARLDKHLWEATPGLPCEFTQKTNEVCAK